jgi:hypothetical protein
MGGRRLEGLTDATLRITRRPVDRIKDFLPGRDGDVGGTAADNRLFVDAVLYRYRSVPWRDLPERFGDCDGSLRFPSLYEGFGMPVVERCRRRCRTASYQWVPGDTMNRRQERIDRAADRREGPLCV